MTTATVNTSVIVLECIDGKDDHFKKDIEAGETIVFGSAEGGTPLEELKNDGGVFTVANKQGVLYFDATACRLPVKLNGKLTTKGTLRSTDVLKIGGSIWKSIDSAVVPNGVQPVGSSLTKSVSGVLGLEELQDFKLSEIFSGVFKKHTLAETEEQLVTGTSLHTPAITDIEPGWAKPWLFSRLILLCIILTVLMIFAFNQYENLKFVPNIIFLGTFVMPIATLIFFLEMNIPRNVSIFLVLTVLFVSGVGSLILTLLIGRTIPFVYEQFNASGAAIVEEPAKLLVVIFMFKKYTRYKWILNGLLFGAAAGAGFGAFESAGYAFEAMLGGLANGLDSGFDALVENVTLRGFLAPFMHVIWTANCAAALWMVKGDKQFEWSMLGNGKFLRIFLLSVATHFIWNSGLKILQIPLIYDIKYVILGGISWVVCFMLIQSGLKQINAARHAEIERLRAS